MTFFLPETDQTSGLQSLDRAPTTAAERRSAGVEAERIETDAWSRGERIRDEVLEELRSTVGIDYEFPSIHPRRAARGGGRLNFNARRDQVLSAIERQSAAGAPFAGELPTSAEAFDRLVLERRRAELDEAQAILDSGPDGAWGAELLGRLYAGATDEATLATLPFGLGGSISRVVVSEAALGVAGEAAVLGRQFDAAEDLGLPQPNVAAQLTIAGLSSAVLGGTIQAGIEAPGRFRAYRQSREEATVEQAGSEGALATERRIDQAAGVLEGEPASPPSFADFDYGPGGNADPRENRIGYIFGRLRERGVAPHIAAGLLGNLMQEGGVAINTRAIGDNGNSHGMGQWNGPRRRALHAFARQRGKPWDDLDTQIDFLFHEFETSEADAWARIQQAPTAREAALLASNLFWRPGIPHNRNRAAYAESVIDQFEGGAVPRWTGPPARVSAGSYGFEPYRSSRGFTREGQVAYGDGSTIDVDYQVIDASELRQAEGALQPRDRGRQASEAWVADTAARLDPAQLLPAPTADRGTPIIGPDNVIESGNGRVRAIERAYQVATDRAAAYRAQIEATTGEAIPEGIERPVLVARRTTELNADARQRFVEDAQDSGVARMTATERARVGQRRLQADTLSRFVPGERLSSAANRDFVRDFLGAFPRSERNAFIAKDGSISQDGIRQVQDSLFARAWDNPAITALRTEAEPGDTRQLIQALDDAAPAFARLRAEVEAGLIRPEFDISGFVIDAVQIIGTARQIAAREGGKIAERLDELLGDVDLFGSSIAPLTRALAEFFYKGGRVGSAEKLGGFLTRYADEAMKAGRVSDELAGDPPGVIDVLQAINKSAFGDLDEIGAVPAVPARVDVEDMPEFADGADSVEATEADDFLREELAQAREDFADLGDISLELEDGNTVTARALIADIEKDEDLLSAIEACRVGSAA
ncbi:MAG: phage tail tip lysozyme [Pseudomonadota bacterium]